MDDAFSLDSEPAELADVAGIRTGAASCGLKSSGLDLAVILSEGVQGSRAPAGVAVFTRNEVAAAPVRLSRPRAEAGRLRAAVVNAGNANCCTGEQGMRDAAETAALAATKLGAVHGFSKNEVLVASTGIIGHPLDMERTRRGVEAACEDALSSGRGDLASAILTTDRRRKAASASGVAGGTPFRVAGVAKGAGMIAPDMATMLAFVATDAAADAGFLAGALRSTAARTFNRITVDGDTSTNDTLCLLSSGAAGNAPVRDAGSEGAGALAGAIEAVCRELAVAVAADGEGAARLIEVRVGGAASDEEADLAARAIANSPLVKTAIAGADPNWGRILAAAGRSGARVDESRATVRLAGTVVFGKGTPVAPVPAELAAKLAGERVRVELDLGLGAGAAVMWTCDFTKDYIEINAHYHT